MNENLIGARILCCKLVRFNNGRLEQLLHIQRSYRQPDGKIRVDLSDEWRPIENASQRSLYMGRTKYSYIDWENVDWTKQDSVLARQLDVSPGVARIHRIKLLKPRAVRHGSHGIDRLLRVRRLDPDKGNNIPITTKR